MFPWPTKLNPSIVIVSPLKLPYINWPLFLVKFNIHIQVSCDYSAPGGIVENLPPDSTCLSSLENSHRNVQFCFIKSLAHLSAHPVFTCWLARPVRDSAIHTFTLTMMLTNYFTREDPATSGRLPETGFLFISGADRRFWRWLFLFQLHPSIRNSGQNCRETHPVLMTLCVWLKGYLVSMYVCFTWWASFHCDIDLNKMKTHNSGKDYATFVRRCTGNISSHLIRLTTWAPLQIRPLHSCTMLIRHPEP